MRDQDIENAQLRPNDRSGASEVAQGRNELTVAFLFFRKFPHEWDGTARMGSYRIVRIVLRLALDRNCEYRGNGFSTVAGEVLSVHGAADEWVLFDVALNTLRRRIP